MRIIIASMLGLILCTCANAQNQFIGILTGSQENPANASPGTGTGTASYDPLTQMLAVSMSYSGLSAGTTNAHIHCCAPDAVPDNAGVAIHFIPAGFATGSTSGNFNATFDLSLQSTYDGIYFSNSGGTVAQARDRLLNAMRFGVANDDPLVNNDSSIAYFNIHTSNFPGGEIRGNIIPIPEPASALLLLSGLAMAVGRTRRR
jgi:hypothetical protein